MKNTSRFLLFGVLLVAGWSLTASEALPAAEAESPYSQAITWLRDYAAFTNAGIASMVRDLRQAERDGKEVEMVLGERLMQCGEPYILHVRSDRIYNFPLTPAQARVLNCPPDLCTTSLNTRKSLRAGPQLLKLKKLKIEGGRITSANIVGQTDCQVTREPNVKLYTHLWISLPHTNVTITKPLEGLPSDGTPLRFSIVGLQRDQKDKFTGPIVVYFTVGTLDGDKDQTFTRYSNTIAALVTYDP